MRIFNTEEDADKYLSAFNRDVKWEKSSNDDGTVTVIVPYVDRIKGLIGNVVLCTVNANHNDIICTKIASVSPNEEYVNLYSNLPRHRDIGWSKIANVIILDVLGEHG